MDKVNITITARQKQFVKLYNLKLSGMVQDLLTLEMIRSNYATDEERTEFYEKHGIRPAPKTFLQLAGEYEKRRDAFLHREAPPT